MPHSKQHAIGINREDRFPAEKITQDLFALRTIESRLKDMASAINTTNIYNLWSTSSSEFVTAVVLLGESYEVEVQSFFRRTC